MAIGLLLLFGQVLVVELKMIGLQRLAEGQFLGMSDAQLLAHVHHGREGLDGKVHAHIQIPIGAKYVTGLWIGGRQSQSAT